MLNSPLLGAVGGPDREQMMVVVLEGPAAAHGDEPRIADFGENHRCATRTRNRLVMRPEPN